MSTAVFFAGWAGLLRVLVVGSVAYVALVVILRSSGKRTLAKLSAFDLVVTVALGSTLATVLLSKSVALAEGVLAMMLLAALQALVVEAHEPPHHRGAGEEPVHRLQRQMPCAARTSRRQNITCRPPSGAGWCPGC